MDTYRAAQAKIADGRRATSSRRISTRSKAATRKGPRHLPEQLRRVLPAVPQARRAGRRRRPAAERHRGRKEKDRRYLLESVVLPNAKIAKGFETVVLTLADDRIVSGIIKSEDKKQVKLVTAEAKELVIPADDIAAGGPARAMPDDLHKKLTRRELRDLVEFLSGLKEPLKK